jgi:hypothetical protein
MFPIGRCVTLFNSSLKWTCKCVSISVGCDSLVILRYANCLMENAVITVMWFIKSWSNISIWLINLSRNKFL